MKTKLSSIVKWSIIVLLAGAFFYLGYPKYDFKVVQQDHIIIVIRGNRITGEIVKEEITTSLTPFDELLRRR